MRPMSCKNTKALEAKGYNYPQQAYAKNRHYTEAKYDILLHCHMTKSKKRVNFQLVFYQYWDT